MQAMALNACDVFAHLPLTGTAACQSYLVGVKAMARPWWSALLKPKDSRPWYPHTVTALHMRLPKWKLEQPNDKAWEP
jgi:hypothetical protein